VVVRWAVEILEVVLVVVLGVALEKQVEALDFGKGRVEAD
jgi:hypothetical protein